MQFLGKLSDWMKEGPDEKILGWIQKWLHAQAQEDIKSIDIDPKVVEKNWEQLNHSFGWATQVREEHRGDPNRIGHIMVDDHLGKDVRALLDEGLALASYSPLPLPKAIFCEGRILVYQGGQLYRGRSEQLSETIRSRFDALKHHLPFIPLDEAYHAKALIERQVDSEVLYHLWGGETPINEIPKVDLDEGELKLLRPTSFRDGLMYLLLGTTSIKHYSLIKPYHYAAFHAEAMDGASNSIREVTDVAELMRDCSHPLIRLAFLEALDKGVRFEFIVGEPQGNDSILTQAMNLDIPQKLAEYGISDEFQNLYYYGSLAVKDRAYDIGIKLLEHARHKLDDATGYNGVSAEMIKASTLTNLGVAYLMTDSLSKTQEALLSALQIEPNNPLTHGYLGLLHSLLGNYPEAETSYQRELEINPNNEVARGRFERVQTLRSLLN